MHTSPKAPPPPHAVTQATVLGGQERKMPLADFIVGLLYCDANHTLRMPPDVVDAVASVPGAAQRLMTEAGAQRLCDIFVPPLPTRPSRAPALGDYQHDVAAAAAKKSIRARRAGIRAHAQRTGGTINASAGDWVPLEGSNTGSRGEVAGASRSSPLVEQEAFSRNYIFNRIHLADNPEYAGLRGDMTLVLDFLNTSLPVWNASFLEPAIAAHHARIARELEAVDSISLQKSDGTVHGQVDNGDWGLDGDDAGAPAAATIAADGGSTLESQAPVAKAGDVATDGNVNPDEVDPPRATVPPGSFIEFEPLISSYPEPPNPQFFVGTRGSGAPHHYHEDAVNVLVYGEKRWFVPKPEGLAGGGGEEGGGGRLLLADW